MEISEQVLSEVWRDCLRPQPERVRSGTLCRDFSVHGDSQAFGPQPLGTLWEALLDASFKASLDMKPVVRLSCPCPLQHVILGQEQPRTLEADQLLGIWDRYRSAGTPPQGCIWRILARGTATFEAARC